MLDLGIIVTGIAAFTAFKWGRGKWLRQLLLIAWLVALAGVAAEASKPIMVFTMTALDLIIAGAALLIVTHDPYRIDAKIVGGISMALMPVHWIMSASHGNADWTIYASAVNAGFVLQCLIVRGLLDGVGGSISNFVHRLWPVHLSRDRRDR